MIIGIAGTNGAGKGAVVEYLTQKGFKHYSARALLIEEIERRGLVVDRSSMRLVANELRITHGPAYIAETLYNRTREEEGDAAIESIRAVKEAEFLKEKGGYIVAVDADRQLRYERIVKRASATDMVDFDTWVQQEEREWHNEEAYDMNVPGVMKMADVILLNESTLAELHAQIDAVLQKFGDA